MSSGLAAKGHLYLLLLESTKPPSQDGSLLAKKCKANVSSDLLGIFSAKSPVSLERNQEAGRPGGGGGGCESCCSSAATPGALQRVPARHDTGISAEGLWQTCHEGQDVLGFFFFLFSSVPTGPYCKASQVSWPSNHSPS